MLFYAAIAIAANLATVAAAITGHATETAAEKSINILVDTADNTAAITPFFLHTKDFKSLRTRLVKREARCVILEKLVNF